MSDPVDDYLARLDHALRARGEAPPPVASEDEPRISDAFVEEVTRRVLERLAPDAVRAVVADVVLEVAERLVREEIERLRKQHA